MKKKMTSYLLLFVFVLGNMPVLNVGATDGEEIDIIPEVEIQSLEEPAFVEGDDEPSVDGAIEVEFTEIDALLVQESESEFIDNDIESSESGTVGDELVESVTVTIDKTHYQYGKSPIIVDIHLPTKIKGADSARLSGLKDGEVVFLDSVHMGYVHSDDQSYRELETTDIQFRVYPEENGEYTLDHLTFRIPGEKKENSISFDSVSFAIKDLDNSNIKFTASVDYEAPVVKDIRYIGEFKPGNTIKIEVETLKNAEIWDTIRLQFAPDVFGSIRLKYIKLERVDETLFAGEFYLDKNETPEFVLRNIDFRGDNTVYVIGDLSAKERPHIENEFIELDEWNLKLGSLFGADALGIKVDTGKKVYSIWEPIEFSFVMNDFDADKFKDKMNILSIFHEDNMEESINESFVNADWNDATESFELSYESWQFFSTGKYIISSLILDASYFGEFNAYAAGAYKIPLTEEVYFEFKELEDTSIEELIAGGDTALFITENHLNNLEYNNPEKIDEIKKYTEILNILKFNNKVIGAKAPGNEPSFVLNYENIQKLNVKDYLDSSTEKFEVKLESKKLTDGEIEALIGKTNNIVGLYDLSLMKRVLKYDGTETTSKIENEDIRGLLTLRIPVPEEHKESANLVVIYVTDEGVVEELETEIVEDGGIKYLEFQTDHFSIYGIMEVLDDEVAVDEPVKEEPVKETPEVATPIEEKPVTTTPVEKEFEAPVVSEAPEEKEVEKTEDVKVVVTATEKLPPAGNTSGMGFVLSGILISGLGVILLRKPIIIS